MLQHTCIPASGRLLLLLLSTSYYNCFILTRNVVLTAEAHILGRVNLQDSTVSQRDAGLSTGIRSNISLT